MLRLRAAVALTVALGLCSTARAEVSLDDLARAVQQNPRVTTISRGDGNYGFFDVKIDRLCGGTGLSDLIAAWVDEATYNSFWGGRIRAATLTVALEFPQSTRQAVKLPIIAMANTGTVGVKLCDDLLLTDIPRSQRVSVRFEFATTEQIRLGDAKPALDALNAVIAAAGQLRSLGGGAVFGSNIAAAGSFFSTNTPVIGSLTTAINSLLSIMDKRRAPRPTQIAVETTTTRVGYYGPNQREIFALFKDWRASRMRVSPEIGYGANVALAYSAAFSSKNLYATFASVSSQNSNWPSNPAQFCEALRNTVASDAEGDRISVYIALAEHASWQMTAYSSFPDAFKAQRKTCLYPYEARILVALGWGEPFPGAFSAPGAARVAAVNAQR